MKFKNKYMMNILNTTKGKGYMLFLGVFLILTVKTLLGISLLASKFFSVYILDNLYAIPYLFFFLAFIMFFAEVSLLRKGVHFLTSNFKKVAIVVFLLYIFNFATPYLEGTIISPYVAENYNREEYLFFNVSESYANATYAIHNLLFIIYAIVKVNAKQKD